MNKISATQIPHIDDSELNSIAGEPKADGEIQKVRLPRIFPILDDLQDDDETPSDSENSWYEP